MEITVYNPQKGRLETVAARINKKNTTWFDEGRVMMVDINEGVLVKRVGRDYPVLIYPPSGVTGKNAPKKIFRILDEILEA